MSHSAEKSKEDFQRVKQSKHVIDSLHDRASKLIKYDSIKFFNPATQHKSMRATAAANLAAILKVEKQLVELGHDSPVVHAITNQERDLLLQTG